MASEKAVLLRHYATLAKNIESLSNGQAFLKTWDEGEDDLQTVRVTLTPREGPYRGGTFDFELDLSDGYPSCPPVVHSLNPVYHPNIDWCDDLGDVCLNLLDELWSPDMTLEDVVQGLLFLFYHPNLEDPLNPMFSGTESEEEFVVNVRQSLRGEVIEGLDETWDHPRNLPNDYESEDEDSDALTVIKSSSGEHSTAEDENQTSPPVVQAVSAGSPPSRSMSISKPAEGSSSSLPAFLPTRSQESSVDKEDSAVSTVGKIWGSLRPYVTKSVSGMLAGLTSLVVHNRSSAAVGEHVVR